MNDFFPGEGRKKITSLFSNEKRYNRSGSITTATIDKEDNIRQSRIMNLPNYKKQTLDGRLDFVVVFQTIEIQRLSVQIESLRVRLADSQRQIFNYKNYQVQIRELNERCFEFENERSQYEEKIAYLSMCVKQAQMQAADFKQKAIKLEDALQQQEETAFSLKQKLIIEQRKWQQSEEGRLMLQSSIKQKQKLYSRQLKQMEKSNTFKKNEPTKNQQHLGNLLKKYHEEVNTLQKQNISLRNLYEALEQQSHDLEKKYEELQEDLYRNNEQLKEKQFQLEGTEQQNRERLQMFQQRYQQAYSAKCKRVEECQHEIGEWKEEVDKLEQEQEKYQIKLAEYAIQCEKYEALLNQAGDEIDRLNTIIKDKIRYLDAWQNRFKELQDKYNDAQLAINAQTQKIAADQQEITILSESLKHKSAQLDKLEKTREQEVKAVKEKLQQIEIQRQQIAAIKREKELQRDEQRRKDYQNSQIKQQLNKRIIQGNKLFQNLNSAQAQIKHLKIQISTNEAALRIKDEELLKARDDLATVDNRIQKIQGEKRIYEQQAMKVKALEQRIKHQQNKKGQYLKEAKKLTQKLKQSEKQLGDSRRKIRDLQADLQKFQKYSQQLLGQIKELQQKLQLLNQLKKEIHSLQQTSIKNESQIKNLKDEIAKKVEQLNQCKQKIIVFGKYMKQFKVREQQFKNQLLNYSKIQKNLNHLQQKYQTLEDKNENLEIDLSAALAQIQELTKENGSLERVIQINKQQYMRIEQLLVEVRDDLQNHKIRQRQLLSNLRELQRNHKHTSQDIERQKEKIVKEKNELQKKLQMKNKQFEIEVKKLQNERQKMLLQKDKMLANMKSQKEELAEENNSFRKLIKSLQDEKQKQSKKIHEHEKKILTYEHELERTNQSTNETQKELEISKNNIEKMTFKAKQSEDVIKQQNQKISDLLTEKQRLLAEIADKERTRSNKESDIAQLLRENQIFQKEITSLQDQLSAQQERYSSLFDGLLKVKYESETINSSYNNLNIRMSTLEKMILILKQHAAKAIQLNRKLEQQKKDFQRKYIEYQEKLAQEIERLEQEQFKAGQENIRLDTMNRILQIEIGQYKERQSAVFSIVKEGSVIKQKKQTSPLKLRSRLSPSPERKPMESLSKKTSTNASHTFMDKSYLRDSNLLKESLVNDLNPMLKSRCGTTNLDEDLEISYCEKKESMKGDPLVKNKNRIYFDNLVFKAI